MDGAALGTLNIEQPPPIWGDLPTRSIDCFEKIEQIGQGTHGQVYKARDIETGELVALKKVRMGEEGFPRSAIREIKILKKLRHENVIRLIEVVTSSGQANQGANAYDDGIYMVFEYMDHDLAGLSANHQVNFTVPQIKCYMMQMLRGLHYCHLNEILHRDVKGENLLIDNKGNLKIADFGLARSYSPKRSEDLTNRVISLWQRPPELLFGATKYGPEVDMWSAGCVLAEVLFEILIFAGNTEAEHLNKIYEICGSPDEDNWPGVSTLPWYNQLKSSRPLKRCLTEKYKGCIDDDALKLLDNLLVLDPSKRISAMAALDADYFWKDPLPCTPESLPSYESSHVLQVKENRKLLMEKAGVNPNLYPFRR